MIRSTRTAWAEESSYNPTVHTDKNKKKSIHKQQTSNVAAVTAPSPPSPTISPSSPPSSSSTSSPSYSLPPCVLCQTTAAIYCSTCDQYTCQQCDVSLHQAEPMSSHPRMPLLLSSPSPSSSTVILHNISPPKRRVQVQLMQERKTATTLSTIPESKPTSRSPLQSFPPLACDAYKGHVAVLHCADCEKNLWYDLHPSSVYSC